MYVHFKYSLLAFNIGDFKYEVGRCVVAFYKVYVDFGLCDGITKAV
jgi:hypothetical protein